jgi:putative hemolysin
MENTLVMVAVTALMIALTALYVAAEFAFVSARRPRIAAQATSNRLAKMLLPILSDSQRLDSYIAACQLGITAASLILGFYGQSTIAAAIVPLLVNGMGLQPSAAQSIAATGVLIILTIFTVVLGELVPKSVAVRYPERTALLTVIPMRWSVTLLRPIIALFNGAGELILRLLGIPPAGHHMHVHSPSEIDLLVAESAKGGLLEPDERQLLRNAFRVGELNAADVMVPRVRIVAAAAETPLPDLLRLASGSAYTRIPVYQTTIDQIVGFVHLKDLFRLYIAGQNSVASIIRTVPFVPETASATDVWNMLQREHSYIAIVFDEFGGTAGMITIEDLIEEIFGEVQDEYDEETALIAPDPDGRVRLGGGVLVTDVNEWFDVKLPEEEANTVGGLVMAALGRIAEVGDVAEVDGLALRVEAVDGHAVREVSFHLPEGVELPYESNGAEAE